MHLTSVQCYEMRLSITLTLPSSGHCMYLLPEVTRHGKGWAEMMKEIVNLYLGMFQNCMQIGIEMISKVTKF